MLDDSNVQYFCTEQQTKVDIQTTLPQLVITNVKCFTESQYKNDNEIIIPKTRKYILRKPLNPYSDNTNK